MKKILLFTLSLIFIFTVLVPNSSVKAQESQSNNINIPEEVLNSLPGEIKDIVSGKQITQEQYDLYLNLLEKEKNRSVRIEGPDKGFSTMASSVNPKNCTVDIGKNYCFRIDPANTSTNEPYHIHIYEKLVHTYCMRLDNFKPCDAGKNKVSKFDDLPTAVKEGVMGNKKVQERVKIYNPDAQKWSKSIPFIKTLAISVIVVALVVTPIPGDEYVAWAYFLRAIA